MTIFRVATPIFDLSQTLSNVVSAVLRYFLHLYDCNVGDKNFKIYDENNLLLDGRMNAIINPFLILANFPASLGIKTMLEKLNLSISINHPTVAGD